MSAQVQLQTESSLDQESSLQLYTKMPFCWALLSDTDKQKCADGASYQDYGKPFVWNPAGNLEQCWSGEGDSSLFYRLESFLEQNGRTIYGKNHARLSRTFPLGLNLMLCGESDDVRYATPLIVISCPITEAGSSLVYGSALRLLFPLDELEAQGFEVEAISIRFAERRSSGDDAGSQEPSEGARIEVLREIIGSMTGKPIFTYPAFAFATFGGVLHLKTYGTVGVSTYHFLHRSEKLATVTDLVYTRPCQLLDVVVAEDDENKLSISDFGDLQQSDDKLIGSLNLRSSDSDSGWAVSADDDWALIKILDNRVSKHNIVPTGKDPKSSTISRGEAEKFFVDPLPLELMKIPESSLVCFDGARTHLQEGVALRPLCLVPVEGMDHAVRAWAIRCECGPGDSGSWVVSIEHKVVLGVIFAASPERGLAYMYPAPTFFESIRAKYGQELSSITEMFRAPSLTSTSSEPIPLPSRSAHQTLQVPTITQPEDGSRSETASSLPLVAQSGFTPPPTISSFTSAGENDFLQEFGLSEDARSFVRINWNDWKGCHDFLFPKEKAVRTLTEDSREWIQPFMQAAKKAYDHGRSDLLRRLAQRITILEAVEAVATNERRLLEDAAHGAEYAKVDLSDRQDRIQEALSQGRPWK